MTVMVFATVAARDAALEACRVHDGQGPDVDPATGDEAETQPNPEPEL